MSPIDWFLAAVRIAGASFPVSSSMVQVQSEVDRAEFERRLGAMEDPLSNLHPDIPALSQAIYKALASSGHDSPRVELLEDEYTRFAKPLALLESRGIIEGRHALGDRYSRGFWIRDPTYLLVLISQFGDPDAMGQIHDELEALGRGGSLDGMELASQCAVPLPFINALFQIYEGKGFGLLARTRGTSRYISKV